MYSQLFRSRTAWTIAVMFVVGGVNAVSPFLPLASVPYVEGILALLGMYFHLNPSQNYGKQ